MARVAEEAGADAISLVNTFVAMAIDAETRKPRISNVTAGLSGPAIKPIALRMTMEIARLIRHEFPGRSLSGLGGIESGRDAAEFILLGADTVQVCTGVMKAGYECVKPMCDELLAFMDKHQFETLADFRGKSLEYFTTHADLVQKQTARKAAQKAAAASKVVKNDAEWSGDDFSKQADALSKGG